MYVHMYKSLWPRYFIDVEERGSFYVSQSSDSVAGPNIYLG